MRAINHDDFKCVIKKRSPLRMLKSKKWKLQTKGRFVRLPRKSCLYITEDGSVYVATPLGKDTWHFERIDVFVKTVNNTLIIENFSTEFK